MSTHEAERRVDLSYVIVSYNARAYLERCLTSIQRHPSEGVTSEVIVVDNASTDGSADAAALAAPHARVVRRRRNDGFAVAANEGLALAKGDVMLLVNPDAELLSEAAGPLVRYFAAHPAVGIVGVRLLDEDGGVQLSARSFPGYASAVFNRHSLATRLLPGNRFSRGYLLSDWDHDQERSVDWVSGAGMALSRRGWETFGGFDPGYFMYIEDVDLCRRARDADFDVVYLPDVVLRHAIGGSTRTATLRMIRARHASMWRYYRKHMRSQRTLTRPLADAMTFGGIWGRCAAQYGLALLRRGLGRRHRP